MYGETMFFYQEPTHEDLERLANCKEKDGYKSHIFSYCPNCGELMWRSSSKDDRPDEISSNPGPCQSCVDTFMRGPEIMALVGSMMRMMLHRNNKILKLCPESCKECESPDCPAKYCISVKYGSDECFEYLKEFKGKTK